VDKFLDPTFWVAGWKTFSSAREIAVPLLILVGGIVWWIRDVVKRREISGLKEQIGSLNEHIGALEQRRLRAIEQVAIDKKKIETLRVELVALRKKIPKGGRHNELAASVDAITSTVTELFAASERLRRRLSPSDL
jgi:chromosome segregation ATPase